MLFQTAIFEILCYSSNRKRIHCIPLCDRRALSAGRPASHQRHTREDSLSLREVFSGHGEEQGTMGVALERTGRPGQAGQLPELVLSLASRKFCSAISEMQHPLCRAWPPAPVTPTCIHFMSWSFL